MSVRVALLTNIPAPYRLAFFQQLAARCDLRVIFDGKSEPNRNWSVPEDLGFPHAYMAGFVMPLKRRRRDGGPDDERYLQIRWGILPELIKFRPEVVISIEFGPRSMQAAVYCAVADVPLIVWSEGTPHSEGWQGSVRRRIRRLLVKRAQRFWTNGVESSELLISYGARRESLHEGMIGVDTLHLGQEVQRRLAQRTRIRAELGVAGIVFLFSGQLVPRKGVAEFLAALLPLAARAKDFSVAFLGDGFQKPLIEEWAAAHPEFRIVILGFRQPAEVPSIYAAVDVFVMPTLDDNWTLVALEAAVAGLPQVFSRYNGATGDLIRRQASGLVIDPLDAVSFSQALGSFLAARSARTPDEVTSELIRYYSPEACSARALESIVISLESRSRSTTRR
jgi:glycosyltransferase involved in cell wall biosynthesis